MRPSRHPDPRNCLGPLVRKRRTSSQRRAAYISAETLCRACLLSTQWPHGPLSNTCTPCNSPDPRPPTFPFVSFSRLSTFTFYAFYSARCCRKQTCIVATSTNQWSFCIVAESRGYVDREQEEETIFSVSSLLFRWNDADYRASGPADQNPQRSGCFDCIGGVVYTLNNSDGPFACFVVQIQ